jgi:hypothetical protein
MPAGRPSTYNFELCKEICLKLYLPEFKSVGQVLETDERFPARSTFYKWKREHKEISDLYVNIQQDQTHLFIEEIDQTIEDLRSGLIDPSTANVIIQALKWKAAKYYPKMFGDKSEVQQNTTTVNVNYSDLTKEEKKDLRADFENEL